MEKVKHKLTKNITIPGIDFRTQKVVSHSQYSLFNQCPHRWYLRYVRKIRLDSPSVDLIFGTAFHETIQFFIKTLYTETVKKANGLDLNAILQEKISELYKVNYEKNNNVHFSSPAELREYYEDGVAILEYLKKKRTLYFSTRNVELVGIELPIVKEFKKFKNVIYKGDLDLVFYDKDLDKYIIIDIKTSKKGWNKWDKTNFVKTSQLLSYKEYFAELYGVSKDKIDVKFLIVKRKIWEESEFPAAKRRFQEFIPASGKVNRSKAVKNFEEFLTECFTHDGAYIEKQYPKKPSGLCPYCPFNETEYCDKKID